MHPKNLEDLEKRARQAAEAALRDHEYASAIDVLCGMGLLERKHLQDWRAGRIDYLERVVHANLRRISAAMKAFRRWAREKGLRPSETCYRHRSHHLRFSKSGDPGIEKAYRTHYVKLPRKITPSTPRNTEAHPTSAVVSAGFTAAFGRRTKQRATRSGSRSR